LSVSASLVTQAGHLELGGEFVQSAVRDRLATLIVDHRVAQHAIEPADDRVMDLVAPVETAHEDVLDDLLGDRAAAHATLDVAEELAVVPDQLLDDLL
jgi:hypothetical protein